MNNFGFISQFGIVSEQENMMVPRLKEVEYFSTGVLLPPNPTASPPSIREKPMGCKTVFVGGLPDKITVIIIKEIFEKSGEIDSIRMSRKNFCHIRFKEAASIEKALYYSGYKMKINNNNDPSFTGRLHVDYATDRDDKHEYECQQRMILRAQRHQMLEYFRPATPPVIHYSEHEASLVCKKIRNEDSFMQGVHLLINWLDRGECCKRNAGTFYSMIQSISSHIRRIITEKGRLEEQLNDAKERLQKQMEGIIRRCFEIEKVFKAACLQKVWDHLSKAQRKRIELWKKQINEIKNAHIKNVINKYEDKEIVSVANITKCSPNMFADELKSLLDKEIFSLREENDLLRYHLEVTQNKIVIMDAEMEEQLNR